MFPDGERQLPPGARREPKLNSTGIYRFFVAALLVIWRHVRISGAELAEIPQMAPPTHVEFVLWHKALSLLLGADAHTPHAIFTQPGRCYILFIFEDNMLISGANVGI